MPEVDWLGTLLGLLGMAMLFALVTVVGKIRDWIFRKALDSFRYNSILTKNAIHTSRQVNRLITGIRESLDCSRVLVFQFHNGDVFLRADHSWKLSATHEVVADGVTVTARENQNILASQVIDWIDPIISGEVEETEGCSVIERCIRDQETCPVSASGHRVYRYDVPAMRPSASRYMAQEQGVGAAYVIPLNAPGRKKGEVGPVMGFLSIQFRTLSDLEKSDFEDSLCPVCRSAEEIEFLLGSACVLERKRFR